MIESSNKTFAKVLWVLLLLSALLAAVKPISLNIVKGSSMFPSLKENDVLVTYKFRKAKVGDIATFEPPKDWGAGNKMLVKRIIAKGGDTVSIKKDKLYINNILLINNLNETYDVPIPEINFTIKESYYLMMGDNYKHSKDSIYFLLSNQFENNFLVNKSNIIGTANGGISEVEEIKSYVEAYNQ